MRSPSKAGDESVALIFRVVMALGITRAASRTCHRAKSKFSSISNSYHYRRASTARISLDGSYPGDGLFEAHSIGIWDVSTHSLLTSALVPGGMAAPLVNGFRYVNTSPITLLAQHHYVIAALFPTPEDPLTGAVNNPTFMLTVSPEIVFDGYRSGGSSVLAYPEDYEPGVVLAFGPNFLYAIPEPSTLALWLLGASMLLGSRKILCPRSRIGPR